MEETLPKKLLRTVKFMIGDRVKHVLSDDTLGIIIGYKVYDTGLCYEVRWNIGSADYYDDFELEQSI